MLSVECDTSSLLNNSSNFKIPSSTPQKSEFVRVNGILKTISITKEEVEGEGVIQVEVGKIGEEVTLTEIEEEEKVEVDSSNDKGEKLEVKSDKCTNILRHLEKRINVLLQNRINFLSYLQNRINVLRHLQNRINVLHHLQNRTNVLHYFQNLINVLLKNRINILRHLQ